jgi:hypothetical protein
LWSWPVITAIEEIMSIGHEDDVAGVVAGIDLREPPGDHVTAGRVGEDCYLLPAVIGLRRQRAEEVVVVNGARHRLARRGHERRVVVRRRPGQHEVSELAAVAVIDADVDVNVLGVLVVSL